ncbi:MAG TPA: peptide transporter [Planctomycetota bacterium]|nr:peptide transporter [Planctomycetota bacterium]
MADQEKKPLNVAPVPATSGGADGDQAAYRDLVEAPSEFEDGFNWRTFMGVIFVAVVMMPTAIYLGLTMGLGLGPAAEWVTIILFADIARRSFKPLKRQELYMLYYVAGSLASGAGGVALSGGPFAGLIWRQYLCNQPFVNSMGIGPFPEWFVPSPESPAILERTFWHPDWLWPIMLMVASGVLGRITWVTMGYYLFRTTSDVEKLPFPMASIAAEGATALAESSQEKESWRWRIFSIGAMLGMAFGAVYSLLPLLTKAFFGTPVQLLPIPWIDTTVSTETFLPAAETGVITNLGAVVVGMVLPFWIVVGGAIASLVHMFVNPLLHELGILTHWRPGMDTIMTSFMNSVDFWMSFGIGTSFAIALLGIYNIAKKIREKKREQEASPGLRKGGELPPGRGDYSPTLAIGLFGLATLIIVLGSWYLMAHPGDYYTGRTAKDIQGNPILPLSGKASWLVPLFLFIFGFIYTPLISYVNARMIGMTGTGIGFPMIREATFIMSGSKGAAIWCAPFPLQDYGGNAQSFREIELTGTRFTSVIKAEFAIYPITLLASFVFWQYIWHYGDPIPSPSYPYAQKMWQLGALNACTTWSATAIDGGQSLFFLAFKPTYVLLGLGFGLTAFAVLKAPTLLLYGFVGGLGALPHALIPPFCGALLGRFYFARLVGQEKWRRFVPVLSAGFFCGVGLISMVGVAAMLLRGCITPKPY